ncbi:MAG: sigma-70 family RNA polymerase sigma factor [Candidatus Latescibacteria bacterium]|nr:sigma-70 family RNA polymerase sigma factor [bacterium]MBD3424497.1 sigma-70 family RNA polymerase sigma factor [Candidatus Latescibacterota bacterium]
MKREDAQLIRRCLKGDEKSYEKLLQKYRGPVFSICLRMVRNRDDAEDLAQDVFIKIFNILDRYNPSFPFSSWLYRITSNLCIDFLRKNKRTVFSMDNPVSGDDGDFERQFPSGDIGPEKEVELKEEMVILENAIQSLPEHYRMIVLLRHQEHLSYDEISETLGIPLGTVKARIHRARKMIVDFFRNQRNGSMPVDEGSRNDL